MLKNAIQQSTFKNSYCYNLLIQNKGVIYYKKWESGKREDINLLMIRKGMACAGNSFKYQVGTEQAKRGLGQKPAQLTLDSGKNEIEPVAFLCKIFYK